MPHIRTIIRKSFMSSLAVIVVFAGAPTVTFANESSDSTCAAPDTSAQAGVHNPTGSDSSTFTYQCTGQYAGDWTNAYYSYDPTTEIRTPLYAPNYGYNCTTGTWTMDEWDYSPAGQTFVLSRVATTQPAGYIQNCPVTTTPTSGDSGSQTGTDSASGADSGTSSNPNASDANATGPNSTNSADLNASNNTTLNNNTSATATNALTGTSNSGNAVVLNNNTAGNATSGASLDEANVINLLQSSSNALGTGQKVTTFTANIDGDVNGDLLFDPSTLGSLQNTSTNTDINNNLTVNNATNSGINNNINLNAASGDATVADNTDGGNATTGSAQAIANVMNYIDSAVTSGQSFIGTININGNLNGDILLPADLIDQLIASNVPTVNVNIPAPNSTNSSNTNVNNNVTVNNTNNQGINNAVNSNATSGSATDSDNTTGGNATTGNATTNVTAFNLTGSDVVGQNDILVFVNVVGKWVGMIVNAPAGATAAELGGGITKDTTITNTADLNNTNNQQINNNINVAAKSGNATVSDNTVGGNAKSGNASTAVNLLNVEGSTLDLSNWFGVLFINVFGTWNGSFGVNTSAGDSPSTTSSIVGTAATSAAAAALPARVFSFVAHGGNNAAATFASSTGSASGISGDSIITPAAAVLAAHTDKSNSTAPTPQLQGATRSLWKPATIIGSLVVLYIVSDAVVSNRRRNKINK
jgi:filamentous hemagglutinin